MARADRAGSATAGKCERGLPSPGGRPSRTVPGIAAPRIAIWCEAGLDTVALLFFPLLVLLPRGVAALVSVAGLCGVGMVVSAVRKPLSPAVGLVAVVLGSLVLWGAMSALWSVDPIRSLIVAARLTGLFALGLALIAAADSVAAPGRLSLFLLVGSVLGIVMALTDLTTAGALSSYFSDRPYQPARLNQASMAFAVLLLPISAMLVCLGCKMRGTLLAITAVGTICALTGTAAKVALIAGLPIGLLLYRFGPVVARVAAVVSVVVIVTAPLSFARLERLPALSESANSVKLSAGHRLLIWSFAGDRIAEQPLVGWGLDASRAIPGGQDPIRPGEAWLPLHPHNAPLQLWLELGVPGVVLFALVVGLAWRTLADTGSPPLFLAAAGASLAVAFVGCFATYGIWQEWWLDTLWFSLFLVLVMARVAGRAASAEVGPGTPAARL
jgi:exopolysaccharide production protein ExoQ